MGDNGELITSLYPPPPPYYKFFTKENLEKLESWKAEQSATVDAEAEITTEKKEGEKGDVSQEEPSKLPNESKNESNDEPNNELKFLIPPTAPNGPTYRAYGNIWDFEVKLPSLKEQGMEQLYEDEESTTTTKVNELKKLLKSLLLNFLELIGMMSIAPENFASKIENIRKILVNIHHLLNQYRPHQSRESLILLLQKQIDFKNNEITKIEKTCNDIEAKIKTLVKTYTEQRNDNEDSLNVIKDIANLDTVKQESANIKMKESEDSRKRIIDELLNANCK